MAALYLTEADVTRLLNMELAIEVCVGAAVYVGVVYTLH